MNSIPMCMHPRTAAEAASSSWLVAWLQWQVVQHHNQCRSLLLQPRLHRQGLAVYDKDMLATNVTAPCTVFGMQVTAQKFSDATGAPNAVYYVVLRSCMIFSPGQHVRQRSLYAMVLTLECSQSSVASSTSCKQSMQCHAATVLWLLRI